MTPPVPVPPQRPTSLGKRLKPTRLGEMLRIYRTLRSLSLRELSAETGIGHATLMRIEHGQSLDAETLLRLWKWMLTHD